MMGDTLDDLESEFADEPEQWGGSADDIFPPASVQDYGDGVHCRCGVVMTYDPCIRCGSYLIRPEGRHS